MTQKERVLRYVNRLRKEYVIGKPLTELPKGQPKHCFACVVGRSLHANVDGRNAWLPAGITGRHLDVVELPLYVRAFIRSFDAGRYPELVG